MQLLYNVSMIACCCFTFRCSWSDYVVRVQMFGFVVLQDCFHELAHNLVGVSCSVDRRACGLHARCGLYDGNTG